MPNPAIGREVKAGNEPEKAKVVENVEKPLTLKEQEAKRKFAEVDEAMRTFNAYPIAVGKEAKDGAVAALKRLYKGGDAKLKQVILYIIHESISRFAEYRAPKNFDYFKKKFPQAEPMQLRMRVYQGMFNYSNSLEGLLDLVNLLADFGDDDSAKVLTHEFSFLCAFDGSEGTRILRNAVADALGNTKSIYALRALLAYAKNADSEQLGSRLIGSIVEWKDRLKESRISQKEKDELMEEINDFVQVEREGGQYR